MSAANLGDAPGNSRPANIQCPTGTAPSSGEPGTPPCELLGKPESFGDMASRDGQMLARSAAPFGQVAPGAFQSALAQSQSVGAPGSVPGSGAAWAPYGTAPLCTGHTTQSTLCPLADNTNIAGLSNGDYTIALLGHRAISGRISSFAYDPATPGRVFASPTAGGVYETRDGGTSWTSIGDNLPTQVIGGIAYDAPKGIILAGSGDNSFGGTGISGHGLYYSSNDGGTWTVAGGLPDLALTFRVVVSPADPSGNTVYVATSKGLFYSANGGQNFFNSNLPTGAIGSQPYTVPDPTTGTQVSCAGNTTTPLCFFANIVTDVVVKGAPSGAGDLVPTGSVMAVVGWRAGQRVNKDAAGNNVTTCTLGGAPNANCVQAPRDGIYVSPYTADASGTGTCKLTAGKLVPLPAASVGQAGTFCYEDQPAPTLPVVVTGNGFAANSVVGRTSLGIAHGAGQNPNAVFALVQDALKFQGCVDVLDSGLKGVCNGLATGETLATYLDGMYASYDFGSTWKKVLDYTQTKYPGTNTALVGLPGYSPGIQSWYNNWVEPDPSTKDGSNNPTRVLFGLEEIWENNVSLGTAVLNPALPAPANGPVGGTEATNPWHVVGRYWNACLGALSGVQCNGVSSAPIAGSTTHPDQHAALFIPDSTGVTLFAGNDGGVYKQHVATGGDFSNEKWGDGQNTGIYSLQPYDATISKDGTVVAGLQDNGEEKIAFSGENHTIFGGDGFFTTIDPNNSQNIIEEYTFGTSSVTLNGGRDWYNIAPGACSSSEALFATPLEEDPTIPGHIVEGCTQIQEAGGTAATTAYQNPCAAPPGGDPFTCQLVNSPFNTVYDLGTASDPGHPADRTPAGCGNPLASCVFNIPSAVGVRGNQMYVGFCGYCDIVTGGLPFNSGIATNVGGAVPGKIGTADGWHIAKAKCASCGTANGLLPKRYINSIQADPNDSRTVFVTLGGYGRRWIPPGSLGDSVANVGNGHLFVSHDAGESFTDISGNLPDAPANYTLVHNGELVVANDLGVYIAPTTAGLNFSRMGTVLPNVPVFTIRESPGNPDLLVAATYGRGVWKYCLGAVCTPSLPKTPANGARPGGAIRSLPNTGGTGSLWLLVPAGVMAVAAALILSRRRRASRPL